MFANAKGAEGDDTSVMLQVDTATSLLGTESMHRTIADLRSLSARVRKIAEKREASMANSTALDTSDMHQTMQKAHKYIVEKLSSVTTSQNQTCGGLCITTNILDSLAILFESMKLSETFKKFKCTPIMLIYWWAMGMLTMVFDQKLHPVDALHTMMQQVTSIGYGTSSQNDAGIKIFHGLHGVLSQLSVNTATNDVFDWALGKMDAAMTMVAPNAGEVEKASVALLVVLAVTAAWLGEDIDQSHNWNSLRSFGDTMADSIYGSLITATTIGYGDVTPNQTWSKAITPLTLPFIVEAFGKWKTAVGGEPRNLPTDFKKTEICQCFGETWCQDLPVPTSGFPGFPAFPAALASALA